MTQRLIASCYEIRELYPQGCPHEECDLRKLPPLPRPCKMRMSPVAQLFLPGNKIDMSLFEGGLK